MNLKFLEKLSQDFTGLLDDKEDYNVIFEIDKELNKRSFTAHSAVLRYRSPYFRKELTKITENEQLIRTIIKPNTSAEVFEVILRFIYGGVVNLENIDNRFVFDLMVCADELEFEELSKKLENYLIEYKPSWLRTHFSLIYRSVFDRNDRFKYLENFCNDIITKYPNIIFDTKDFTSIKEAALVSLLKRDDLQIEEVKIWDKVIQWGIAQDPTLPSEVEKWSKENFKNLKRILQQCLPLIRYFQFSGEDVANKLKPYKRILEKQLWNDIMDRFLTPDKEIKSIVLPERSGIIQKLPKRTNDPFSKSETLKTSDELAYCEHNTLDKLYQLIVDQISKTPSNSELTTCINTFINTFIKNNQTTSEQIFNSLINRQETPQNAMILGVLFQNGIGITKDDEKAFQWYMKSAEGGDTNGQNNLGYCYQYGIGTIKDNEKAFQWYMKSAEGGNVTGQNNLGICYRLGIGTTQDNEKAFQWYQKSAEGGNIYGQNNLGDCYERGIGTMKDYNKAFQCYLKSAEGGNSWGQKKLGIFYHNGIGITKNVENAQYWFDKSEMQTDIF